MKAITHCFAGEALDRFLHGHMSGLEEAATHEHLESCPACREKLQQVAGDDAIWREARDFLADTSDVPLDPGPGEIRRGSRAADAESQTIDTHLLAWMGPTDDPTKLGRVGAFEVIGVVGYGGAGVVLKALDARLNRYVAIKVLLPALAHNAAARRRFEREARAVAAISHQNVVPIHTVDTHDGIPYFAMQYVAGLSLQQRIDAHGPLEVTECVRIAAQIARALAAAHAQGVIHRDIKPANVLLESNVDRVLVTDFGLARVSDEAAAQSGVIAGTPQYMSPEQCRDQLVDHRSDLFSLGSVMYAMCTGRPPFRAESLMGLLRKVCDATPRRIREINPEVPEWLEALIARLMRKRADDRFRSAAEVAAILEGECAHLQNPVAVRVPARDWFTFPSAISPTFIPRRTTLMTLSGIAIATAACFSLVQTSSDDPSGDSKPLAQANLALAQAGGGDEKLPVFDSEESRSFAVEPGKTLTFKADVGQLDVFTSDERQVAIKITRKIRAANRADVDKLSAMHRVAYEQNAAGVEVKAELDRELRNRRSNEPAVSQIVFHVTVPRTFNLKLETAGGSISLQDPIVGEVRVKTSGGNIRVAGVKGPVGAETSGGNVTAGDIEGPADLHTSGGDVKAGAILGSAKVRTSGGDIDLGKIGGEAKVVTSGGNITLGNVAGAVDASTSGGNVNAVISKQPEKDSVLKTTGGSIKVSIARNLALSIDAKTVGGTISAPFLEKTKGRKGIENLSHTLNGGGKALSIKTTGGNVKFEYLED